MPPPISKKTVEHLAELARLDLDAAAAENLLHDLERILGYMAELNEVDTNGVEPMTGGTLLANAMRNDNAKLDDDLGKGKSAFPERECGLLKVPKVFE